MKLNLIKKIKIKVNTSSLLFSDFLLYNKISYSNLEKYKNYYTLIIDYNDYYKFKRYECLIIRYYGIYSLIYYLNTNKYMFIGILCGLIILYLLCNTIFDVIINTDDEEIIKAINNSLISNDLVKYKKKKSYEEIEKIKENIIENNRDLIEWIEIKEDGCNYIIDVTKRVSIEESIEGSPSNIIASKDGLIKHTYVEDGILLKDINDYVKKGDILISGTITKNDEVIDTIEAKGKIYAQTWYIVNISMPFEYKEYYETGKVINHYYIKVFNKEMTLIGKYDTNNTINEKKLLIDKPYLFFDLYKETKKEYGYKTIKLSVNDAYSEAMRKTMLTIENTLDKGEYIISKKVLKKTIFSSKIDLEVFYKVYEEIGITSRIEGEYDT